MDLPLPMKPPKPRLRTRFKFWFDRWIGPVSTLVVSVALVLALLQIGDVVSTLRCRAIVSSRVSEISDRIDAVTARIVVASIADDQVKVIQLSQELNDLVDQLEPAIEDRNKAAREC